MLALGASVVIVTLNAVGAFGGTAAAGAVAFACILAAVAVREAGRRVLAEPPAALSTDDTGPVAIKAPRASTLVGERTRQIDAA